MAMRLPGLSLTTLFCAIGMTAFAQVSLASTFTTLSNFPAKGPNVPVGSLTRYKGGLFGACERGGKIGYGGVFKLQLKNDKEKSIHDFSGTPDGEEPQASLTASGSLLYGTTASGGTNNGGTIYSVDPMSGMYETLYSFPSNDGPAEPSSALTSYGATLIGTTTFGGNGVASLYQFDPATGNVTTLYAFTTKNQNGF